MHHEFLEANLFTAAEGRRNRLTKQVQFSTFMVLSKRLLCLR